MTNYRILALATALAALSGASLAAGPTRYTQAASGSSLSFAFEQAGAMSQGAFKKFDTSLSYDAANLAASTLKVTVQIASLDTQDAERDTTLKTPDLFDATKHPTATFVASSIVKRADGKLEAVGKLTIRGTSKDFRLPVAFKPMTLAGKPALELTGEATIKRLDYGVGQGEWKSTEWVGDAVKLTYKVNLVPAAS